MNKAKNDVLGHRLLIRAGVSGKTADYARDSDSLTTAVMVLQETVGDGEPPDPSWWKDCFMFLGWHMVLTDEGWSPPFEQNPDEPVEILDEVNRP